LLIWSVTSPTTIALLLNPRTSNTALKGNYFTADCSFSNFHCKTNYALPFDLSVAFWDSSHTV
jgi:hypothetical protein